jgi:hypothetical protein
MHDPRRAGRVQRYHTWPHIKEQSVAEHSWQVARLMRVIWPSAPTEVMDYCLFHDIGEVVAGDPPYPSKVMNPAFGTEHAKVEEAAVLKMTLPWGMPPPVLRLRDPVQQAIFKLVHFIEMAEWAMDEITLGNQNARLVLERCRQQSHRYLERDPTIPGTSEVPEDVIHRAWAYIRKRDKAHDAVNRTPE